jgi:lipoprotein-releasing system permease protein
MKYPIKVALRYIFSIRKFQFITFISFLSALGIIIGVSALIIVTSIFNGLREFAQNEIIGVDPHIRIYSNTATKEMLYDICKLVEARSKATFYPFVTIKAIVEHNQNVRVAQLFAIADTVFAKHPIVRKIVLDLGPHKPSVSLQNSSVIGISLADALRVLPGKRLSLLTIEDVDYAIINYILPSRKELFVTGIFQTNNLDYDNSFIILPESSIMNFLRKQQNATYGLDIRFSSLDDINDVAREIRQKFPELKIYTWYDLNKDIMNAMQFEKYAVFIILSLIISIAVFNILASLFMTVLEKQPDIAILMAMGSPPKDIKLVFKIQGLLIGAISTFIGLLLGVGFTLGQIHYGWLKLNAQKYLISSLPMKISVPTVVAIVIVSVLLSYLATIYPSNRASKTLIVDSIFRE